MFYGLRGQWKTVSSYKYVLKKKKFELGYVFIWMFCSKKSPKNINIKHFKRRNKCTRKNSSKRFSLIAVVWTLMACSSDVPDRDGHRKPFWEIIRFKFTRTRTRLDLCRFFLRTFREPGNCTPVVIRYVILGTLFG